MVQKEAKIENITLGTGVSMLKSKSFAALHNFDNGRLTQRTTATLLKNGLNQSPDNRYGLKRIISIKKPGVDLKPTVKSTYTPQLLQFTKDKNYFKTKSKSISV